MLPGWENGEVKRPKHQPASSLVVTMNGRFTTTFVAFKINVLIKGDAVLQHNSKGTAMRARIRGRMNEAELSSSLGQGRTRAASVNERWPDCF